MEVREATREDIPALVELGKMFFEETVYREVTECDSASLEQLFLGLIANPDACLFLLESEGYVIGSAAGMLIPFYFNLGHRSFQELFWYVDPRSRKGRGPLTLFVAVEKWARAAGAESMMVTSQVTSDEGVNRWYRRRGYLPNETHFIRRL